MELATTLSILLLQARAFHSDLKLAHAVERAVRQRLQCLMMEMWWMHVRPLASQGSDWLAANGSVQYARSTLSALSTSIIIDSRS